ncbi:hypothetical protein [Streptomyces sp. NPDC060194]|uniref:hypothetical protein n=1 Tax=Streptomyces sp. NPDC060194 TaxID=3347069 RepID=UPI00364F9E9C
MTLYESAVSTSVGVPQALAVGLASMVVLAAVVQLVRPEWVWRANLPAEADPGRIPPRHRTYVVMRTAAVVALLAGALTLWFVL